jgi:hypothetical protein
MVALLLLFAVSSQHAGEPFTIIRFQPRSHHVLGQLSASCSVGAARTTRA